MNNQLVFIPGGVGAVLYQYLDGNLFFKESPMLYNDFHLGSRPKVGSVTARSYHSKDWWQTSLVFEVVSIESMDGISKITFKTFTGSTYLLEVSSDVVDFREDLKPIVESLKLGITIELEQEIIKFRKIRDEESKTKAASTSSNSSGREDEP